MFEDTQPQKKNNKKVNYLIPVAMIVAVLIAVIMGSLLVVKLKPELIGLSKSGAQSTDPKAIEKENEKTIQMVSDIILLPEGEEPTIAEITDLSKAKTQDFFKNAELGDKVLVYTLAKKAFLYRPSTHRIIEVGVVNSTEEGQVGGIQTQNQTPEIITPTPLPESPDQEEVLSVDDSPTPTPVTFQP